MICIQLLYEKLLEFCKSLCRSSVCAKYGILISTKGQLAEKLPKWQANFPTNTKLSNCHANAHYCIFFFSILNDLLAHNSKSDGSTDSALVQYYFFQIVSHNHLSRFSGKCIELSVSYWRCLFEESFSNLKVLNLALCCNDIILEMIPKYCPHLEYLNATSKYLFRDAPSVYRNANRMLQLPVSDAGLCHLQDCKRLRILVINEPRGEHPIATNQITYSGLRHLLRHVTTLEDISYSDIGYVITTHFSDISTLNLTTVRHIHPTASTMREIFRLCKRIALLNLNGSSSQTAEAAEVLAKEMCAANQYFNEIEFQNIYFGTHFQQFFSKFGHNLVSLSLSFTQAELNFEHIVIISLHCPNLRFFLCNNINNDPKCMPTTQFMTFRPFSNLRSLHLSGNSVDIENLLRYCTEYACDLEVLKIHELKTIRYFRNGALQCINAPNLRLLELSRLICSRTCIESIIQKFCFMNFLIVQCSENCCDLIDRIKSQNYDLVFVIQPIEPNVYF